MPPKRTPAKAKPQQKTKSTATHDTRGYTKADGTRVSGYTARNPKAKPKPPPRIRTLGQHQPTIHREDFVHFSQRHRVKNVRGEGWHYEWKRHKRRIRPEIPDELKKLKVRLAQAKPETHLKPQAKIDPNTFDPRSGEGAITYSTVPDFEDDILGYIEPIPDGIIEIGYAENEDGTWTVSTWIAHETPKSKKRDTTRGRRKRGGSNPYH